MDFIFTDRGAWHGYTWGERSLVDCVTLDDGQRYAITSSSPVRERAIRDDRLDARLADGSRISIYYLDARTAAIQVEGQARLDGVGGPVPLHAVDRGYYHQVFTRGPEGPGRDLAGLPRTLRWNWREPVGDIRHGGIVPSPLAYPGFWAWDSWKHAAVLPRDLARDQIAAMFDYQSPEGMVPDTVRVRSSDNCWRCTKPPLAAWAASHHSGLLSEFRPAIERYHRWWEEHRRPPGERLFAYGGSDLEASKWESGWDNATRYDDVELREGLQSILSVDLNAYICLEKRLLGVPDPDLERLVNETFFHDGAFYDVTWPEHRPVRTLTAATWIPLWCGIADAERAHSVIERMLDPRHFATQLPFPTVSCSDPKFNPSGYWRGPVWFDHAAWAVEVLERYGYVKEALQSARTLLTADPDWECYDPLTAQPARGVRPAVPQFSWTAAARLSLEKVVDRLDPFREGRHVRD